MHRQKIMISILVILTSTTIAHSADMDVSLLNEQPIVLSASRLKQPVREAPLPVTVIDREIIESLPVQTIAELMRLVPGYIVSTQNRRVTTVTNHGLGGEQARNFQVLIDGRSVYSGILGGVDWANVEIDLEDIERIEAIRAPNAVSYGANAFLGVVNIITFHSSQTTGNRLKGTLGWPDDTKRIFASHGDVHGDLGYRISMSWLDDGERNGHRPLNFSGRVDYRISPIDTLELQLGYGDQKMEDGLAGNPIDPFRTKHGERNHQLLRWHRTWNTDDEMILTAYHNHFKMRDSFLANPSPSDPATQLDLGYNFHRYDIEAIGYKRLSDNLRSVFGGELRRDRGHSDTFVYPGDRQINNLKRIFARGEWRNNKGNLLINTGAIYEDASIGGSNLSPMASINFLYGNSGSLRASYSEAYRYPVIYEEEANTLLFGVIPFILSPGDLNPVHIRSYDLGLRDRYGELAYELRLFKEEIDDLIMVQNKDGVLEFRNSDSADIQGIEVQLEYRIDWFDTLLIASYAYIQIDSANIDGSVSDSAPRHNANFMAIHHLNKHWTLSETFNYMSPYTHILWDEMPDNTVDRVRKLDTRLKHTWVIGENSNMSLSLAALNILDEHSYILPNEERGREYRAEIALQF